nr:hypothetical protein [uncultured Chryseobacterium sp.]
MKQKLIAIAILATSFMFAQQTTFPEVTIQSYSPTLYLKRNVDTGGFTRGIQTQKLNGENGWFFGDLHGSDWIVSKGDYQDRKLVINENGNVGINFNSPSSRLTVYEGGGIGTNNFELRTNHVRNAERYFMKSIIFGTGTEDVTFSLRHDGQMYVGGNVGIGTLGAVSKLDLGNNYSDPSTFPNKITLWSQGANNYFGFGVSTASLDYFSQGQHRFFVGYGGSPGTEVLVLKPNGNAALQGKFEAKEIKVTLSPTADFVFDEKYNLPKLEDVEKHIKEKKHLPEIASAKVMEKEGVNIGEFQIKLLQKIEELTLYSIEQNKRINQLQEENELLKDQSEKINQLEKKVQQLLSVQK